MAEVKVTLTAEDELTSAVKNAQSALDDLKKSTEELEKSTGGANEKTEQSKLSFTELKSALDLAGTAIRAVGQAYDATVGEYMANAGAVRDLSIAYGISAEQASALREVADDLDVDMGALSTAFRTLKNNGLQPNIDTIKDLAAQFQAIKDPVARAEFAAKMFGQRAGPELTKLLSTTPEAIDEMVASAEKMGKIFTDEDIAAAEEYRRKLDDLKDSFEGLKQSVVEDWIPALITLLDLMNESAKQAEAQGTAWQNLTGEVTATKSIFERTKDTINNVTAAESGNVTETGSLANAMNTKLTPALGDVGKALGNEKLLLEGIPPAVAGYITATGNAATSAGAMADETDRAALAIVKLEEASVGAMILNDLTQAFKDGKISEEEYLTTSANVMRDMLGMTEAEIQMALKTREIKGAFDDGKLSAEGYAGAIDQVRRNLEAANNMRSDSYLYVHVITDGGASGSGSTNANGGYQDPNDTGGGTTPPPADNSGQSENDGPGGYQQPFAPGQGFGGSSVGGKGGGGLTVNLNVYGVTDPKAVAQMVMDEMSNFYQQAQRGNYGRAGG